LIGVEVKEEEQCEIQSSVKKKGKESMIVV
jgi:hypothetical protein